MPKDFNPIPSGLSRAGLYHTHGAFDPKFNAQGNPLPGAPGYDPQYDGNENFGSGDKDTIDYYNVPGFLATPQGTIKEYIPKPGRPLGGKLLNLRPHQGCDCQ